MKYGLITLIIAGFSCLDTLAQNVTVINHFAGDTTGEGFELTGSGEHRIVINYYEPVSDQQKKRLEKVVGATLDYYVDENIVALDGKISLKKKPARMLKEMNELVKSAVQYYSYRDISQFKGFSKSISDEIETLGGQKIPSDKQGKERQFLLGSTANLKRKVNEEVGNYSLDNLVIYSGSEETFVDNETRERLLNEISEPFDSNQTLAPILSGESISLADNSYLPLRGKEKTPTSSPFEEQVLKLLEHNNLKLDRMQGEIDDLRLEQARLWKQKQDETNGQLQAQINELRGLVVDLVRVSNPAALANTNGGILIENHSSSGSELANLPASVNVYFAVGSTTLDGVARLTLNEMVDILARNSQLKVLITGYADKSGSEWKNLLISQERARAVRKFFGASGLPEERFIMQYYGARDSQKSNPSDRKVVLEFIR